MLAKIASDLAKPDGIRIVEPGTELAVLHPLPVRRLWGVGPATHQRLERFRKPDAVAAVASVAALHLVPIGIGLVPAIAAAGLTTASYPYLDPSTGELDADGMLGALAGAAPAAGTRRPYRTPSKRARLALASADAVR